MKIYVGSNETFSATYNMVGRGYSNRSKFRTILCKISWCLKKRKRRQTSITKMKICKCLKYF